MNSAQARGIGYEEEKSPTLRAGVVPATLKIRSGCPGGGKGALIQENKSATLSCNNDQTLFVPKVYGICGKHSNSMMSDNPNSGFYEADTSRTIDTSNQSPCKNQGGMVVVEGNGSRPSHHGDGYKESETMYTLNCTENHAVSYGIGRPAMNQGYNARFSFQIEEEKSPTLVASGAGGIAHPVYSSSKASFFTTAEEEKANTLVASDYKDPPLVNDSTPEIEYIVRRLTPQECALLQGMPTWWCDGLGTENPTEEQIVWWQNVFENYNKAIGKECKPKSRKQIEKWLKNPYSDSAACSARTIKEDDLQQAFVEALQIMIGDSDNYLKKLKANLNQIIVDPGALQSIDDRLNKLQHELIDRTERHEDYSDIAEEIFALREQREKVQVSKSSQAEYKKRIKELQFFIKSQPKQMEFDETLAKHLLSKITVFDDHVIFEFKSGVTVSVEM